MALSRHGRGPGAAVRAIAANVHPVFMLPPIAAAAFGAIIADAVRPGPALLHVSAIAAAMYTAHVRDAYIDFYVREEDDDTSLTAAGCRKCLIASTGVFALCLAGLWVTVDWVAVALTAPGWLIGYLHAPYLDMHPVGATAGYPAGIALAVLGGHYVQVSTIGIEAWIYAGVLFVLLVGVKIIDDLQDFEWDRSFGKSTVAVRVGPRAAWRMAFATLGLAGAAIVIAAAVTTVPSTSALATVVFAPVAFYAKRAPPEIATMLLVRGSYLFLAVLVASVWFTP